MNASHQGKYSVSQKIIFPEIRHSLGEIVMLLLVVFQALKRLKQLHKHVVKAVKTLLGSV